MKVILTKEKVNKIKSWLEKHEVNLISCNKNDYQNEVTARIYGIYFGGCKVLDKLNIKNQITNDEYGEFIVSKEGLDYINSKLHKHNVKIYCDSRVDGMKSMLSILEIK